MERKKQFSEKGVKHATINGVRFHLRTKDPIAENFLWLNGQQPPLVLDETAADFVKCLIEAMWQFQQGEGDESRVVIDYVVEKMYKKYGNPLSLKNRVSKERLKADLDRIFGTLMSVAKGACPKEIGLEAKEIKYGDWISPARMDLAVTYHCNLKCEKCYLDNKSSQTELTTEQWVKIYQILWGIGIPQIVFTGGEPTLRPDIVTLVSEAEEFVTGLVTNGTTLDRLARPLKDASLDYIQITIESFNEKIHDSMTGISGSWQQTVNGIKAALKENLQVVTNTTLTKINTQEFNKTIEFLANLGVRYVACNTLICAGRGSACRQKNGVSDDKLKTVLEQACLLTDKLEIGFQWYSPTCYTLGVNPIELGLGIKTCSAAAHNMTIEPDGSVLPCQSWPKSVGNILNDPWPVIWNHPECLRLRKHQLKTPGCQNCIFIDSCAGGCPLDSTARQATLESEKGGQNQ